VQSVGIWWGLVGSGTVWWGLRVGKSASAAALGGVGVVPKNKHMYIFTTFPRVRRRVCGLFLAYSEPLGGLWALQDVTFNDRGLGRRVSGTSRGGFLCLLSRVRVESESNPGRAPDPRFDSDSTEIRGGSPRIPRTPAPTRLSRFRQHQGQRSLLTHC
jgi:hypothetical protein